MKSASNYSQKTQKLALPVLGYGDTIEPDIELEKWQRIENILLSCLRGERTAIFKEGKLSLSVDGDGFIVPRMSSNGLGVICCGMAAGRYFEATDIIVWPKLTRGNFYYLYIATDPNTITDSSHFNAKVSSTLSPSQSIALVATVDLRGDDFLIDRSPPGKVTLESLRSHIEDNRDPHGPLLYQKNLVVDDTIEASNALIGELRVNNLIVGDRVLRLTDAPYIWQHAEEVELKPGENRFNATDGFIITFAQCLNNDSAITFRVGSRDGHLDVVNKSFELKRVIVMFTEQQVE